MTRRELVSLFSVSLCTSLSGCLFGRAHSGRPDRISGYIDNFTDRVIEPTVVLKNFEDEILYQNKFVVEPSEELNSEEVEFEYKNPELDKYLLEVNFENRETRVYHWEIVCNTRIQIAVNSDTVNFGDSIC